MCNYLVYVIQPHHPASIFDAICVMGQVCPPCCTDTLACCLRKNSRVYCVNASIQSVLRTGQLKGQLTSVIHQFEDKRAMELKNDAGKRLVYEIMKLIFPPQYTNIRV